MKTREATRWVWLLATWKVLGIRWLRLTSNDDDDAKVKLLMNERTSSRTMMMLGATAAAAAATADEETMIDGEKGRAAKEDEKKLSVGDN